MEISAQYVILPDLKMAIEYFSGQFNLNQMVDNHNTLLNDNELRFNYNLITDFRDSNHRVNPFDLLEYNTAMKSNSRFTDTRKIAILANTANQGAVSYFYVRKLCKFQVEIEVFFNLKSALEWLKLSTDHIDLIERIISKMKINTVV